MDVKIVNGELVCPFCGGNYLHQVKTSVYQRSEDDDTCTLTVVEGFCTQVTALAPNDGNPSGRRQGLVIRFDCEFSGGDNHPDMPIELCIAQHKGNTLMFWRHEGRL